MSSRSTPTETTARRASRRRWVRAGFGAALALILTAAGASYVSVRRFLAASRDISRSREILRGLDGVLEAPPGAGVAAQVADLRRLLAGDPQGEGRLDALSRLAAGRDDKSLDDAVRGMRDDERVRLESASTRLGAEARWLMFAASFARLLGATVVVLAFLAVGRYMNERERAEDALREARDAALRDAEALRVAQEESRRVSEHLRGVLDQVDNGVMLVGVDGRVSLYNRAAEHYLGAWRDQFERALGDGARPFLRPDGKTPLPLEEDPVARALSGETVRGERVLLRVPSRPGGRAVVVSATPQRTPQGLVTGALLSFREAPDGPSAK